MLNTYLSLCTEYYELDKPFAPKHILDFYLQYIINIDGLILEPMCGTGRYLIPFMEAGHQIEGFDASDSMLNKLIAKCKEKKLFPKVWNAYLQDLQSDNLYSFIFIPSGSFGLIKNLTDVKQCLINIRNSLKKNGIFVFEVETLNAVPNEFGIWKGSIRVKNEDTKIINSSLEFPPDDNIGSVLCRYDLVRGNEIIKTEIETYEIRLYNHTELEKILFDAGFSEVKFIKAFEHNKKPDVTDELIVVECRK